jgi:hypothetical protein
MLYYFLVDLTSNGNYYTIAIEGKSQEVIESELFKHFRDVRFMYNREKKKRDNAVGIRKIGDMVIKYCKHSFDLGTNRTKFRFEMIPDKRHKI